MGVLALLAALVVLVPLVDLVVMVVIRSLPALSLSLFTSPTQGAAGGLENAILGTLLLVGLAMAISVPVGVAGGVYLGEFARTGRLAGAVRFSADVLTGVPSIVLGYFGYVLMVVDLGWGFSALAGAVTLAIMAVPYIVRSTQMSLDRVDPALREASLALGAGLGTTVARVTLRAARPGIVTGILIALSVALGETAPLLYTAGWSSYPPAPHLLHAPVGYLTYVVWTFINEPMASAQHLAYAAALLLMLLVLGVNVLVRRLVSRAGRSELPIR